MLKPIVVAFLSFFLPFSGSFNFFTGLNKNASKQNTGTLEKMIVMSGDVSMNLDLNKVNGNSLRSKSSISTNLRFDLERNSFFSVLIFNDELRTPLPSAMPLVAQDSPSLRNRLGDAYKNLVVEKTPFDQSVELVVRDGKTGFVFFRY